MKLFGTLDLLSASLVVLSIAAVGELIYIGTLLKQLLNAHHSQLVLMEAIAKIVHDRNTSRQSRVKQDDIDMPRPPITRPTMVQRPREESVAPRGGRMSQGVKRERNADGVRHDRELRSDSGREATPE